MDHAQKRDDFLVKMPRTTFNVMRNQIQISKEGTHNKYCLRLRILQVGSYVSGFRETRKTFAVSTFVLSCTQRDNSLEREYSKLRPTVGRGVQIC